VSRGRALELVADGRWADGGVTLVPETVPAKATLTDAPPSAAFWTTSGSLAISSADIGFRPDGGAGVVAGQFTLGDDGFSLAGTFSTPYCFVDLCGTE